MIVSSISFLFFFFPIVFLIYYMLSFKISLQNIWLFIVGILFYAWGEPIYVLLLLASILFNWSIGLRIGKSKNSKGVLFFGVICNLLILILFKYIGPLVERYGLLLSLPVGLSFYTLSGISYLVDIYKKDIKAEKKLINIGLYISFFPKVFLGPLVRYSTFHEQIANRTNSLKKCGVGACRFVTGLGKVVLLAGNLGVLSDIIFSYSAIGRENFQVPAIMAWLGLAAFMLQIYFDFSGYSDMAIGLGLMFGFKLEENFDYPYSALSVKNFWERFNITFMNWFREYIYFPLGGSENKNKDKMVRNLFLLWILIGLWYGTKSNFLLWGILNFFFILAEYFLGYTENPKYKIVIHIYTIMVVGFGFVLLRAQDIYQAGQYYMNMFAANYNGIWNGLTGFFLKEYWMFLILGCVFSLPLAKHINQKLVKVENSRMVRLWTFLYPIGMFLLFVLSLSYLIRNPVKGFWYFRY